MYPETLRGGRLGGPVAFFDHDYSAVVIMSPLNNFMAANMETELDVLNFGLMGSIEVRNPFPFLNSFHFRSSGKKIKKFDNSSA